MSAHKLLDQLKQRARFVQGQRVVLDKDVAAVYGISTGQLRRAVKRGIRRFPPDFLLVENNHYFFTESGILMVALILKGSHAAKISLDIVSELFAFPNN